MRPIPVRSYDRNLRLLRKQARRRFAVFEAKFMLPWSFSEQAAAEKYPPRTGKSVWPW